MNLPGFDAEASLCPTVGIYHRHARVLIAGVQPRRGGVTASLDTSSGCGPCTELKWPNGGGTGACAQDCCDVLGRCQIQSCACSGSASASGYDAGMTSEIWPIPDPVVGGRSVFHPGRVLFSAVP
jgi:hypothetical protein